MRGEVAAKRYAQAAFEIALERDEIDRWLVDLQAMAELAAQAGVPDVLDSTRVAAAEKERLLEAGLPDVGPLALNMARLLVDKRRFALAEAVREEFAALADEHRGVAHGTVFTAIELSSDERDRVAGRLGELIGKDVLLESDVDPDIVGGMVARVGDWLIDGSTRKRLLALKRELETARR